MSLNIITEKQNDLLGRKELELELEFQGATPKTADVKKDIASLTKSQEDLIVIKVIKNKYGEEKAICIAYVYNSIEELKKLEEYVEPVVEAPKAEETSAKTETQEAPTEEKENISNETVEEAKKE